jgi:phosphoglycolate phosphatase-like HAD superfamily hydrolase
MTRSRARAMLGGRAVAAIILDVDGTMYDQTRVRRTMLVRILKANAFDPGSLLRTVRIVRAYRGAQEELRSAEQASHDLAEEQCRRAADRLGIDVGIVRDTVDRWMERAPLDVVGESIRAGLREFLKRARARGIRLGVVSDYPAAAKLEAMGVAHLFDTVVTAQDRDVQSFKPAPRGIAVALERLAVSSDAALYVGDRGDIDAEAAKRARVDCVLIGGGIRRGAARGCLAVGDFEELSRVLYH